MVGLNEEINIKTPMVKVTQSAVEYKLMHWKTLLQL
jgi:hypothetical protein